MVNMSLHEYIESINKMLEEAKGETEEATIYLEELNSLFLD